MECPLTKRELLLHELASAKTDLHRQRQAHRVESERYQTEIDQLKQRCFSLEVEKQWFQWLQSCDRTLDPPFMHTASKPVVPGSMQVAREHMADENWLYGTPTSINSTDAIVRVEGVLSKTDDMMNSSGSAILVGAGIVDTEMPQGYQLAGTNGTHTQLATVFSTDASSDAQMEEKVREKAEALTEKQIEEQKQEQLEKETVKHGGEQAGELLEDDIQEETATSVTQTCMVVEMLSWALSAGAHPSTNAQEQQQRSGEQEQQQTQEEQPWGVAIASGECKEEGKEWQQENWPSVGDDFYKIPKSQQKAKTTHDEGKVGYQIAPDVHINDTAGPTMFRSFVNAFKIVAMFIFLLLLIVESALHLGPEPEEFV